MKPWAGTNAAYSFLTRNRSYRGVRLLNEGRIPFHRVATHRRVLFKDVMAYRTENRRARRAVLDELTRLDQELGLTSMTGGALRVPGYQRSL